MPIPVITNFTINDRVPFDTRLVATNSNAMYNMDYPYEGLTIYRTDLGKNFTFNGETWSISSNGIYGGSGELSSANTIASFGTVSTTVDTTANNLTFRAYSGDSGIIYLDLKNTFIRNFEDANAQYKTVSYKTQLNFTDNNGIINGPFISYNPNRVQLGGISFGTYDEVNLDVYERMIIEGGQYGFIRIFLQKQPTQDSKSLNIGFNSFTNVPFLGYDWWGDSYVSGTSSCYIEFNNDELTFYSITDLTPFPIKTAVFTTRFISLNRSVTVNGNLTFAGSLLNNSAPQYSFNIGRINNGFGGFSWINDRVTFNYSGQRVGYFNSTTFVTEKNVTTTYATPTSTSSNVPSFSLGSRGLIVDNKFNPGANIAFEDDMEFTLYGSYRINQTQIQTDTISIIKQDSSQRTDGQRPEDARFRIAALSYTSKLSSSNCAFAEYILTTRPYDRIISFYCDSLTFHIAHRFSWYIGKLSAEDLQNQDEEPGNWKKMGVAETGNADNINVGGSPSGSAFDGKFTLTTDGAYPCNTNSLIDPSFNNLMYQIRTYSGTVIVPAGSHLKIRFDFPYQWDSTLLTTLQQRQPLDYWAYCMSVIFTSQRIGNYNITGGQTELRIKQDGTSGATTLRKGSDYQYPYERFVSTISPSQTWGKKNLG